MSFSLLFVLVSWISVITRPTLVQCEFEKFSFLTCFVFWGYYLNILVIVPFLLLLLLLFFFLTMDV